MFGNVVDHRDPFDPNEVVGNLDVKGRDFLPDETCDQLPSRKEKEEAYTDLVKQFDEVEGGPSTLLEKMSFLTLLITQNQYSNRVSLETGDLSADFLSVIGKKKEVDEGSIPDKEQLNEIAFRHTKIHPAVETEINFF
jgi:hypothetical protein